MFKLRAAADLVITNAYFTKYDRHLLTYHSGNACSKIDHVLVWKNDFKSVCDVKVIGSEEFVLEHKLLVGDLELDATFSKSHCIPLKRKLWKLSDQLGKVDKKQNLVILKAMINKINSLKNLTTKMVSKALMKIKKGKGCWSIWFECWNYPCKCEIGVCHT